MTSMARKLIYISGTISNGGKATPDERLASVKIAADVAAELIVRGFAVICPQLTEYLERITQQHFAHEVWMEIDFPIVERCDAVLRLPGPSKGSDMEVEHAQTVGVPVVYSVQQLEDWRRCELAAA